MVKRITGGCDSVVLLLLCLFVVNIPFSIRHDVFKKVKIVQTQSLSEIKAPRRSVAKKLKSVKKKKKMYEQDHNHKPDWVFLVIQED